MYGKIYDKKYAVYYVCIYDIRGICDLCDTKLQFVDYSLYIYD